MLVLFETPAGFSLFKVLDDGKLKKPDDLYKDFETAEGAGQVVKLKGFSKFEDTTEALEALSALEEGKLPDQLKKFLKKQIVKKELQDELAVQDAKLGNIIKKKLDIPCVTNSAIMELTRGIRNQMSSLITGLNDGDLQKMVLGLAHSMSRYKLKFSPDKVDTMIVQAISLLDDLDKELNTYAMRAREWYGWHFPEMGKVVTDNMQFAKVVIKMGMRQNINQFDFSDILAEEVETELKEVCRVSMGTEISETDIENIQQLCTQVIALSEYRVELSDYLKARMNAIAPNLTHMVGEIVGARLISHAGSLMNLAKHPASTVQILGAEKALFRALKTKHETPKYGLIFHASLIGQTAPKLKGKMSRVLAAKTALSIRVDALGDADTPNIAIQDRAKVEARLRQLEGGARYEASGSGKGKKTPSKYEGKASSTYNSAADSTLGSSKKRKASEADDSDDSDSDEQPKKKSKKDKKDKKEKKKEKKEKKEKKKDKKKEKEEKKKRKRSSSSEDSS
eukprot:TRINITY_DN502_c0_g5_i1.p1 TRINITY_DN502_c0_g5~~TRINITY_DN502_c0_g5_i1.p1  ORF type:complete len:509 (-),score=209.35 TRINITY_DN502_c0_g5_i1:213-1739(-)